MPEIIDFHAHIYPDKIALKAAESIGRFYSIPMGHSGTVDSLIESGKRAGIGRFVVQSVATSPKQVHSINDFISESVQAHPRQLVGLGTLHPGMEDPKSEIERIQALGLHGVKIHPDVQQFLLDDERMMSIYATLAEKKLPMLIHCGDYRYPYSHPERLARVLDRFPGLTVVAAHFGGWSLWDLAMEYLLSRRCYLDTSSSLAFLGSVRGREIVRAYGAERLVFGVDFPMWDHDEELERFMALGLSEEENQRILHDNALKILGLSK